MGAAYLASVMCGNYGSLGNYGLASDTLVEHLRKGKHLYKVDGQSILLMEEVGRLIAPETAT